MNKSDAREFELKVLDTARRESMFSLGENVLVALSGGADSMALLHFLCDLREQLGIAGLFAAHVNHGLRGSESERDESFVREHCSRLGVPLKVFSTDIRKKAADLKQGLEETGRQVRYEYLAGVAARLNARVATAHTLSDNLETLLLNITRGSGLRGLCGIPPIRTIKTDGADIRVLRPLLFCTRLEIEEYCRAKSIEFIDDSTNSDISFARNRIRKLVIPQLKEINTDVEAAVSRLVRIVSKDAEYLDELAQQSLLVSEIRDFYGGYDAHVLAGLSPSLRTRAIRLAVQNAAGQEAALGLSESQTTMLEGILQTGGVLTLNRRFKVQVSQGRLLIFADIISSEDKIELQSGITCEFYGRIYRPAIVDLDEFEKRLKIHKNLLKYSLNYDKIVGNLIMRGRKPGDKYRPAGRNITKTIKKLFNEQKIPSAFRDTVPVVCDRQGVVLIGGVGCDERVSIDSSCRRVMVLEIV